MWPDTAFLTGVAAALLAGLLWLAHDILRHRALRRQWRAQAEQWARAWRQPGLRRDGTRLDEADDDPA